MLMNVNIEHSITKSQPSYFQNRYICRRLIFVIIILVIMAVTPQNQPYQSPTPGEITLMAFAPNNGTSPMSDTLCQELKDCGFNSAAVETTQLNAGPTITNCQNHGIKPFLHVAGMEDSVATCQPYVNHPIRRHAQVERSIRPSEGNHFWKRRRPAVASLQGGCRLSRNRQPSRSPRAVADT